MASVFDKSKVLKFTTSQVSETPFRASHLETAQTRPIYFSDVNGTYGQDTKGILVYDQDAVDRQINNILSTPLGSDDFEPTFGSLIAFRIMDNITSSTAWIIRNDTVEAVRKWMGDHIEINFPNTSVRVIDDEIDAEGYIIDMPYVLRYSRVLGHYTTAIVR